MPDRLSRIVLNMSGNMTTILGIKHKIKLAPTGQVCS